MYTSSPYISFSMRRSPISSSFFFFNDTATTEIYTLSLHDALPIFRSGRDQSRTSAQRTLQNPGVLEDTRSEEHTSELQSHLNLVCRLLLEKKKNKLTHARYAHPAPHHPDHDKLIVVRDPYNLSLHL